MSEQEIENSRLFDAQWERTTRPLGGKKPFSRTFIYDPHDFIFSPITEKQQAIRCPFPPHSEEMKALELFRLSYPLQEDQLKKRYKELVKKFHPDVNQGCQKSEKILQDITHAYDVLKKKVLIKSF
jgi:hypothetical protein